MKLVKLIPDDRQLFHFGINRLEKTETIFHSDSLFSAIINNYVELYGRDEVEEFIKEFPLISSVFHYIDIMKKNVKGNYVSIREIFFVPKPLLKFKFIDKAFFEENKKQFKKIEFISLNVLNKWNRSNEIFFDKSFVIDNKYLIDKDDKAYLELNLNNTSKEGRILSKIRITKSIQEQKLVEDRTKAISSNTYYVDNFQIPVSKYFIEKENYLIKPGFYFLFEKSEINQDYFKTFCASIKLICDQGLGGKRTSGKGFFNSIRFDELELPFFNEPEKKYMNFSLVLPNTIDEAKEVLSYDLRERKGFVYSNNLNIVYRKSSFRMFKEGSLFNSKIKGRMVNACSGAHLNHPVSKFGRAFLIPIYYVESDEDE